MIKQHLPTKCYSHNKMATVKGAVIHYISAKNTMPDDPFNREAIIDIFKMYNVSAHYLIERDGTILELVPNLHKAYHAGYSRMNGRDGCNKFTLSYELVGGSDWPYTDEQMIALGTLLAQDMTAHNFTSEWVQGHDKIRADWISRYPSKVIEKKVKKKVDPGEHFPWNALRDMIAGVSDNVATSDG